MKYQKIIVIVKKNSHNTKNNIPIANENPNQVLQVMNEYDF